MKASDKVRDITLKNMIILATYIAVLILCLVNFDVIISILAEILQICKPFIIGVVVAFIFNIPMKYFYKKIHIKNHRKRMILSAILSIIVIVLILFLVVMVVMPQIIENIKALVSNMPEIVERLDQWLNYLLNEADISPDMVLKISEFQSNLGQTVLSKLSTWVPSIALGVTHFTASIMNVFMGCVMAFYMVFSKDKLLSQIKKVGYAFLSPKQYERVHNVACLVSSTFENFFTGQMTESIIIGVLCYIGCIILNIPYASIAAVVIGFTNIIPYFGPFIGAAISAIIIVFVSPVKALIFIIFSSLLQQFESNIIYPHVVGSSVGLSALWVLFAVSIGGGLFGIPGMIFGLPTFSVIYELMRRWTNQLIKEKKEALKVEECTEALSQKEE